MPVTPQLDHQPASGVRAWLGRPWWQGVGALVGILALVLGIVTAWRELTDSSDGGRGGVEVGDVDEVAGDSEESGSGSDQPSVIERVLFNDDIPDLPGWERDSSTLTQVNSELDLVGIAEDALLDLEGFLRCPDEPVDGSVACESVAFALFEGVEFDWTSVEQEYDTSFFYDMENNRIRCAGRIGYPGESLCVGLVSEGVMMAMRWNLNAGGDEWSLVTDDDDATEAATTLGLLLERLVYISTSGTLTADVTPGLILNRGREERVLLEIAGAAAHSSIDIELQSNRSDAGGVCPDIMDGPCDRLATEYVETDQNGQASVVLSWRPCAALFDTPERVIGSYRVWARERESGAIALDTFRVAHDAETPDVSEWGCS